MKVFHEELPSKEGKITIKFSELEITHILLDLESQSKNHRSGTVVFKDIANKFLRKVKKELT